MLRAMNRYSICGVIINNLMQAGGFSVVTIPPLKAFDDLSIVTRVIK